MLNISLPRGDIRNVRFKVTEGTTPYTDFDEVYFTVKSNFKNRNTVIQKKLSDGTIEVDTTTGYFSFKFTPEDTNDLEYGKYVFDIEVVKGDVIKQTTLGELEITQEVTFSSNE